jgi:hypothetical protein
MRSATRSRSGRCDRPTLAICHPKATAALEGCGRGGNAASRTVTLRGSPISRTCCGFESHILDHRAQELYRIRADAEQKWWVVIVPWRDETQLRSLFKTQLDDTDRDKVYLLYALHRFLHGAIPSKNTIFAAPFEEVIQISEYARGIISKIDVSSYSTRDVALACIIKFFHQDFLIDI